MKPSLLIPLSLFAAGFALLLYILTRGHSFILLSPAGSVGMAERDIMLHTVFLMLIVVVPVMLLTILIAWYYREGNTKAVYTPNWEHSRMEELIWWSIPFEIVLVLAALTWTGTHALDPARPLASSQPPYVIEVVALPWKWLFIYPQDGVASVNEVALPAGRPVEFRITADAPMNSFWIPALGGQEYAMTGMTTVLNLEANTPGEYPGRSANYSGEGFAQMTFTAKSLAPADFSAWMATTKASGTDLSPTTYHALAAPSDAGPVRYFGSVSMPFSAVVNSFMASSSDMQMAMPGMMDMH